MGGTHIRFVRCASTLAFMMSLGISVPVIAEQPGADAIKQDHEKTPAQPRRIRGKTRMEMYQHLEEMQRHSRMMEGMTDQQQLMLEMKKHMRMADTLMERMMMQLHRGNTRLQQGSGYHDHDAAMERGLQEYYERITRPQQGSESQTRAATEGRSVTPAANQQDVARPEHQESHSDEDQ